MGWWGPGALGHWSTRPVKDPGRRRGCWAPAPRADRPKTGPTILRAVSSLPPGVHIQPRRAFVGLTLRCDSRCGWTGPPGDGPSTVSGRCNCRHRRSPRPPATGSSIRSHCGIAGCLLSDQRALREVFFGELYTARRRTLLLRLRCREIWITKLELVRERRMRGFGLAGLERGGTDQVSR